MTYQQQFNKATSSKYGALQRAIAEIRNKRGRVTRVGRILPFTLAEFRVWFLAHSVAQAGLAWKCHYCAKLLTESDWSPDHRVPLNRGGELGLSNLCVSCQFCNLVKGQMTESAFQDFRKGMFTFPEADRVDVFNRLAKASKLMPGLRHLIAQANKRKELPDGVPTR